jgi:hypothetical protein
LVNKSQLQHSQLPLVAHKGLFKCPQMAYLHQR